MTEPGYPFLAAPHALGAAEVAAALGASPEQGLSDAEAQRRLLQAGPNVLDASPPPGFWLLLLRQFESLLILLLLGAAGLSYLVGDPQDALVILAVLIFNALLGAFQEHRAERALAALREMSPPTARVRREGRERVVAARDVVPGDVVLLRAGDLVAADGRLVEMISLQVDESPLTGESLPVEKDASAILASETALPDRTNMTYLGTAVTFGHGDLVVTATGSATEMGQIARATTETGPRATPLQRQVAWLARTLSILAVGASAAVFLLGLARGVPPVEMFLVGLSLAVAAVPEGLPAVVTIVLSVGVQRMARRNAVVRRLAAVEALGAATVICTDKTGTLTLGEMRVATILTGGRQLDVRDGALLEDGRAVEPGGAPELVELSRAAALANNAQLAPVPVGDPTERALLLLARELGIDREAEQAALPRVGELPFSSDRKRMSTLHRPVAASASPGLVLYVKGAPDTLLPRCTEMVVNGQSQPLDEAAAEALHTALATLADRGLRLLAIARRRLDSETATALALDGEQVSPTLARADEIERDLTLLGVVGLLDPPRPEVPAALAAAGAAGVRTIMITGDHPVTAEAIASRLGIASGRVVTGAEMEASAPAAVEAAVAEASVFARVAPRQKVQIVQALQRADHVVAMTGDGANDAPALRLADIGVAMGIRGTAVAREAAGMVLTDDHYATIVAAIEEGRAIYANLRKAVLYLLSGNLGEILAILGAMLLGLPLPLQAVQILWVNLLTDAVPGIALGMERPEPGIMARPPRSPGEPFLPRWTVPLIAVPSVLLAVSTLVAFVFALARAPDDLPAAQSAAFVTLVLAHLGIGWAQRSTLGSVFGLGVTSNLLGVASVGLGVATLLLLLYVEPLRALFHTRPLDATAWAVALALTPLPFVGSEAAKALVRRRHASTA